MSSQLYPQEGSKDRSLRLCAFTNSLCQQITNKELTSSINDGLAKFKRLVAFLLLGRFPFSLAVFIGYLGKQLLDVRVEADAQMRVDGSDALLQLGEEGHFLSGR